MTKENLENVNDTLKYLKSLVEDGQTEYQELIDVLVLVVEYATAKFKEEENFNSILFHTKECPDCGEVFSWEYKDVFDEIWLKCPDCGRRLCILD